LVYPVPDDAFPFLGVHFTKTIYGKTEVGPNAVPALKRTGYNRFSFSFEDTLDIITCKGFWKMAARYKKTAIWEIWRSLNKRAFTKTVSKMMPAVKSSFFTTGGSGVRAQAIMPDGKLCDDFEIIETPTAIHILNAPSPAATASIAIGEIIAQKTIKPGNFYI
jgi:L-2-hydroxyglutarate oxidase LhgO